MKTSNLPGVSATILVALLVSVAVPIAANHVQTESGRIIVFDHVTGNEWWVEVALSGQDAGSVASVEAQDTNGPWTPLAKKSWGPYAASFHIEPGNQVRFRASWAGGAQQVSCWFTHPAGVEQCPSTSWPTTVVGDAGNPPAGGGDMAVGDADNDGRRDVTIGDYAGIYTFEYASGSWGRQRIGATTGVEALAVGDGDGDGQREVYAMSNGNLVQARFLNGAWSERVVLTLPQNPNPTGGTSSGDMTLGNIDGVAGPELYIALGHVDCDPAGQSGCSTTSYVYRVALESGTWRGTQVSTSGGNIRSMWIGDGDSDGDAELYVGRTSQHAEGKVQVQKVNGAWETNFLPGDVGTGSQLVVGDVDRDGRSEVYTASWTGDIGLISYAASTGWTHRVIATLTGAEPDNLFIGDADNDGRQDLYVGQSGDLVQVRYDAGLWKSAVVARQTIGTISMLVVGDGDGDGRNEAYAGALSGQGTSTLAMRVIRMGEAARTSSTTTTTSSTTTSTGTGTFDATFTGVRGNEWWVQANVATNGPAIAAVDVRLYANGAWGNFLPVTKQSWGYGSSYHITQGTIVQLRATASNGQTDLSSCRQWIPPSGQDAAIVTCPGSSTTTSTTTTTSSTTTTTGSGFDATFTGVKGNEWWVQVNVAANQPLSGVAVRTGCSLLWQPLTKQSWGGWAASFQIPAGTKLDFQARSTSLASEASGGYIWPNASPTTGCPQGDWPRQGSTFAYSISSGVCGGGNCESSSATVRGTMQNWVWRTTCVGNDHASYVDGTTTDHPWTSDNFGLPPSWLTPQTQVGAHHRPDQYQTHFGSPDQCELGRIPVDVIVQGQSDVQSTANRDANGNPVMIHAWHAESDGADGNNIYVAHWDTKTGMVLDLNDYPRMSGQGSGSMTLIDTNAPLAVNP